LVGIELIENYEVLERKEERKERERESERQRIRSILIEH
jgi:hypothetical protein